MALNVGSTQIGSVYLGRTRIAAAYYGSTKVYQYTTPNYNPLNLPPYTIRLKFNDGVTPSFSYGTASQVSSSPNIWDLTYTNSGWFMLLRNQSDLIEIMGANSSGVVNMSNMLDMCYSLSSVALFDTRSVTSMTAMFSMCFDLTTIPWFDTPNLTGCYDMFYGCRSLTSLPLLDTRNVATMKRMCYGCSNLTAIPLFDTSSVTDIDMAFNGCSKVETGALALYQQASTQATPPSDHAQCFTNCGSNTTTGLAELNQIPTSWGGLMS